MQRLNNKRINTTKMKTIFYVFFIILIVLKVEYLNAQTNFSLLFPKDKYTTETIIVTTSTGTKEVTYHSFMHIPYVAKPVDTDYQSLDISVPVKIDGKDVDASNAPVFFNIKVGGYMSVRNSGMDESKPGQAPGGFAVGPRQTNNTVENQISSREDLALAAGFVVVTPGCRGRDNRAQDGTYYGKAPAVIVDLKAAVRYLRHNKDLIPGNKEKIISVGCSAGGAVSALLGASGNSGLFDSYLNEIGAAKEKDNIFGSACYSPITDLEHADMAYEWNYGTTPTRSGLVNQELSEQLKSAFDEYQASLNLSGKADFGKITAENYKTYLLYYYLYPSFGKFINSLSEEERKNYLNNNSWTNWSGESAGFSFDDYTSHVGRMKGLPAFDDFEMKQPEPNLFGNKTINARHFTNFSLRYSSGNPEAEIESEVAKLANLMNAMYFIGLKNKDCAPNWWIRNGTSDNHTSQTVAINMATSLENSGKNVNTWLFWDGGHCADDDPEGLILWIADICGFSKEAE